MLFLLTACPKSGNEYVDVINSTDYVKQVEILPIFFDFEKVEQLFQSTKNSYQSAEDMFGDVLNKYLIALIETGENKLLRDSIVDILGKYRLHDRATSILSQIAEIYPNETLEIIIPELIRTYDEIEEVNFWERFDFLAYLRQIYFIVDEEKFERVEDELDSLRKELDIVGNYARQVRDGSITIDDVPSRYRPDTEKHVEALSQYD